MRRVILLSLLALGLTSPLYAQREQAITRPLAAANACVTMDIAGMGAAAIQVSNTYSGTVTWTASANAGDFVALDAFAPDDMGTPANSTTSTGLWVAPVASLRQLRACLTNYVSGTATVTLAAAGTGGGSGGGDNTTANNFLSSINTAVVALQADVATWNSLKRYISVGTTEDESQVKATAGTILSISARISHATADAFLKCTNLTAASTTPGTSAIFYEMLIPAGPSGMVDGNINATFDTALTCYIVLSKADTAVDEVGAGDVSYNLRYR
jgi:hypothetical protein